MAQHEGFTATDRVMLVIMLIIIIVILVICCWRHDRQHQKLYDAIYPTTELRDQ